MKSVGTMEKMFRKYRDVAEFRLIYIREAHALDSNRPNQISKKYNINEHKNYEERCQTAERLITDGVLTMPMLVDDMKNSTDKAYQAKPDRVFLVRTDGKLAVAAERGPRGFTPALLECNAWLEQFVVDGKEPELKKDKKSSDKKPERNRKS